MIQYLLRIALSIILIASAIGLIVYGIINTEVEVHYEVTEDLVYEVPVAPIQEYQGGMSTDFPGMPPAMPGMPPDMSGMPPGMPGMPPQPDPFFPPDPTQVQTESESATPAAPYATETKTETVTTEVVDMYREWNVIREVTIGGLALEDGTIIRTYVGDPPALCPT